MDEVEVSVNDESNTTNLDKENIEEKQEARAFLRERFLRCINSVGGEKCVMKTLENTEISGTFQCMDMHGQTIFIKYLNTPFAEMKNSLVRSQDIYYIHFPDAGGKL